MTRRIAWTAVVRRSRRSVPARHFRIRHALLTLMSLSLLSRVAVRPPAVSDIALAAERDAVDLRHLPLGDRHVSTAPQAGYVWSCMQRFGGGGAQADGPWIHDDGTFDLTAKLAVSGQELWPNSFSATLLGDQRVLSGNGLPDHPSGRFPIAPDDPAYAYDRNPNSIRSQQYSLVLPAFPAVADSASCLPLGPIGYMLNGVALFNALDAGGRDAVAHELQDACQAHPQPMGIYHYHSISSCLDDGGDGHSAPLGYALDGFGIFGHRGEDGTDLTNADLDECHGHTHAIWWDGQLVVMYHYHATWEYPYTVGCFRGQPVRFGPQP